MNSNQFKAWPRKQGCTFETKAGAGHIIVRPGDRKADLPMHGGNKELGKGDPVMLIYPVHLEPDDNDTILATFPDVPEAVRLMEDL